jgi:hypothetical protein
MEDRVPPPILFDRFSRKKTERLFLRSHHTKNEEFNATKNPQPYD